jgi:hypothetical protein
MDSGRVPDEALRWDEANVRALAFKLRAMRAFGQVSYVSIIKELQELDHLSKAKGVANAYASYLTKWMNGCVRSPAQTKRTSPAETWQSPHIRKIFEPLAQLVYGKNFHLPPRLLQNLELLIPDAIYHALYAKMGMTSRDIEELNQDLFGTAGPKVAESRIFNVFRYSCEKGHPIAHGTLMIAYNKDTGAHRTIEQYKIQPNKSYELNGSLVRAGNTYRIFSTQNNTKPTVAQVMLVKAWGTPYTGATKGHENLVKQLRGFTGVVFDVHRQEIIYATRILIRRRDAGHNPLFDQPGTLPSDPRDEFYIQNPDCLRLRDDLERELEIVNPFGHDRVIGFDLG